MNIPNLPTDSLYKFGFVGSLLLTGLAIYILVARIEGYNELSNKIDVDQAKLQIELKSLEESYRMLTIMMEGDTLGAQSDYILPKFDQLEEKSSLLDNIKQQTGKQVEVFKTRTRNIIILRYSMCVLIAVGLFSTYCCGRLWYTKLQFFQDELIRLQYEKEINKF